MTSHNPLRRARRRRGRLQELPNMPLDIIFEVFSHMEPMSLLNLSRTTKTFRQLLLDKRTSATFWRNARRNVPTLPDCPSFMSEPAFANLCFDSHCHKCLRSNVHSVLWTFRARYCRVCKPPMIVLELEAKEVLSRASAFSKDYDIHDLLVSESRWSRECVLFHRPDLETLLAVWKDSVPDVQEEIHASQGSLIRSIRETAQKCERWQYLQKSLRSVQLDNLRAERYTQIINRLRAIGWGDFLDAYTYPIKRRLIRIEGVRQARPLTDRAWNALRGPILDILESVRSNCPPPSRTTILNRIRLLSDVMHAFRVQFGLCFPGVQEFASMTEVREMLMTPEGMKLTHDSFQIPQESLGHLIRKWIEEKTVALREIVLEKVQHFTTADVLGLGVALCYRCRRCHEICLYPRVLAHTCRGFYGPFGNRCDNVILDETKDDPFTSALHHARLPAAWTSDSMTVEVGTLTGILIRRGMDPSITTIAEMDALDAIDRLRGTLFITWRGEAFQRLSGNAIATKT